MSKREEHPAAPGKREAIALRRLEYDRRHEHAAQQEQARRYMHPESEERRP